MQKKPKKCATPGCDKEVSIIVTHGKSRVGYCKACGRKALEDKHGQGKIPEVVGARRPGTT